MTKRACCGPDEVCDNCDDTLPSDPIEPYFHAVLRAVPLRPAGESLFSVHGSELFTIGPKSIAEDCHDLVIRSHMYLPGADLPSVIPGDDPVMALDRARRVCADIYATWLIEATGAAQVDITVETGEQDPIGALHTNTLRLCGSTFTPPPSTSDSTVRTWRCDGVPGHDGGRHGGPADDKPGNRASWPTKHDDSNYPGERTVLSLAELRTAFVGVVRQRDQVIGAWQQYVDFAAGVTALAIGGADVPAQHLTDALTRIPEWARPKEAAL